MTAELSDVPPATGSVPSAEWLLAEEARLLEFAVGSRSATGGFGWLDNSGAIAPGHPI